MRPVTERGGEVRGESWSSMALSGTAVRCNMVAEVFLGVGKVVRRGSWITMAGLGVARCGDAACQWGVLVTGCGA